MTLLAELTLRGSVATILVILLDRCLAGRMSGSSRRLWWLFVPLAYLVPLPSIKFLTRLDLLSPTEVRKQMDVDFPASSTVTEKRAVWSTDLVVSLWLVGVIVFLTLVAIRTLRAHRRWASERFSTDPVLLELLETCRRETGVTAPIGLVISRSVPSPAILGWLRPRILLPGALVSSTSVAELRPILLHELAHFRWCDVPFNWLLTLVRAAHWFNPVAHYGFFRISCGFAG